MKTNNSKKQKIKGLLPLLSLVAGILLMVFKMYADSEPGAIPFLLIVVGGGWYFLKRIQMRSQKRI